MMFESKTMLFHKLLHLKKMTTANFYRCNFNYKLIGNKNEPHLVKDHLNEYQYCVSSGAFLRVFL
jgi:hypothetical protein